MRVSLSEIREFTRDYDVNISLTVGSGCLAIVYSKVSQILFQINISDMR